MTETIFNWIHVFNVSFESWNIIFQMAAYFFIFPLILLAATILFLPLVVSLIITLFVAAFDQSKESFFNVFIDKVAHIFYICSDIMVPIILLLVLIAHLWMKSKDADSYKKSRAKKQSYQKRNPRKKQFKKRK